MQQRTCRLSVDAETRGVEPLDFPCRVDSICQTSVFPSY